MKRALLRQLLGLGAYQAASRKAMLESERAAGPGDGSEARGASSTTTTPTAWTHAEATLAESEAAIGVPPNAKIRSDGMPRTSAP